MASNRDSRLAIFFLSFYVKELKVISLKAYVTFRTKQWSRFALLPGATAPSLAECLRGFRCGVS